MKDSCIASTLTEVIISLLSALIIFPDFSKQRCDVFRRVEEKKSSCTEIDRKLTISREQDEMKKER